jgi:hypothetical protein
MWIYAIKNSFFSRHELATEQASGGVGRRRVLNACVIFHGKAKPRKRRKHGELKLFYFWNTRGVRQLSFHI